MVASRPGRPATEYARGAADLPGPGRSAAQRIRRTPAEHSSVPPHPLRHEMKFDDTLTSPNHILYSCREER